MAPKLSQDESRQAVRAPTRDGGMDVPPVAGHIAVPAAALRGGEPLAFALHRRNGGGKLAEYHPAGAPFTDADRAALADEAVQFLYVANTDHARYRRRAEGGLADLLADKAGGDDRFALAWQIVVQLVEEILEQPADEHVERAAAACEALAQTAVTDAAAIESLWACRPEQYRTADHMVAVCVGSLRLAGGLELDAARRPAIALGGLLHDAGKMGCPESISLKEGHLIDAEWQFVVNHPRCGADWLERIGGANPAVVEMALSHHERLDGRGYPNRLGGELVGPWARLCAIVDTFELLTTGRPYRSALADEEAIGVMAAEAGSRFDPQMIEVWRGLSCPPRDEPPAEPAEDELADAAARKPAEAAAPLPLDAYLPLPPLAVSPQVVDRRTVRRSGGDRRVNERYRFNISCRVQYLCAAGEFNRISFWVNTVDISRSGIQFVHTQPMRIGEMVSIFLPGVGGRRGRNVTAMVTRSRRRGIGLHYIGAQFDTAGARA